MEIAFALMEISIFLGNFRNEFAIMSPSELPAPPTHGDFGRFLEECLRLGIRPPTANNFGKKWDDRRFADDIKIGDRQLTNYRANLSLPRNTAAIEMALFGEDPSYLEAWRLGLQDAFRRTKKKLAEADAKHKTSSEEASNSQAPEPSKFSDAISRSYRSDIFRNLRETGPTIIGGIGIAQGIAHLINSEPEDLLRQSLWDSRWIYADLLFGIGGIFIGLGCIGEVWWARKAGICYCIAALMSAVFWFADEGNSAADVQRVVWVTNVLNPLVSGAALWYFLVGWPEKK